MSEFWFLCDRSWSVLLQKVKNVYRSDGWELSWILMNPSAVQLRSLSQRWRFSTENESFDNLWFCVADWQAPKFCKSPFIHTGSFDLFVFVVWSFIVICLGGFRYCWLDQVWICRPFWIGRVRSEILCCFVWLRWGYLLRSDNGKKIESVLLTHVCGNLDFYELRSARSWGVLVLLWLFVVFSHIAEQP